MEKLHKSKIPPTSSIKLAKPPLSEYLILLIKQTKTNMRYYRPFSFDNDVDDDHDDDDKLFELNPLHIIIGCAALTLFMYLKEWYENRPKDAASAETEFQIQNPGPDQLQLGTLIWQSTNLNAFAQNSYCYHDTQTFCHDHGKLYNWEAAQQVCKSLGEGWRLPTNREWKKLMVAMGEFYPATVSFSGFRSEGEYHQLDTIGAYWTSSEVNEAEAWSFSFSRDGIVNRQEDKGNGFSCRCVKEQQAQ